MPAPLLMLDVAGPDAVALRRFYHAVFGWGDGTTGEVDLPAPEGMRLAIRPDAAEKRLYVGVDSVEAALARVEAGGGVVERPRVTLAGGVIVGLFRDPAGNAMAVVEMVNGASPFPWSGSHEAPPRRPPP